MNTQSRIEQSETTTIPNSFAVNSHVLQGTPKPEKIDGTHGKDVIASLKGDDTVFGFDGDDVISGGSENDSLEGNQGNDVIYGDYSPSGNAHLIGIGYDTLHGGSGDDQLYGQSADDTIYGDSGNDYIEGGADNDIICSGSGNDIVYGDDLENNPGISGDDTIYGGSGQDALYGGRGKDVLYGDSEGDLLVGGLNHDVLDGGDGGDLLVGTDTAFSGVRELGFGFSEVDTLTGGKDNDTFVLGLLQASAKDASGKLTIIDNVVLYNDSNMNSAGTLDYALITDFGFNHDGVTRGQDVIQLVGSASDYLLSPSPISSISGTGIFLTKGEFVPELIGIVEGIDSSTLSLENPSQFVFVFNQSEGDISQQVSNIKETQTSDAQVSTTQKSDTSSKAPGLVVKFGEMVERPTLFPDQRGWINLVVENQSDTTFSGPVTLNLYASTDRVLDPLTTLDTERGPYDKLAGLDELLGSLKQQTLNLAPGESQTFSIDFAGSEFQTPSIVSPGLYYLLAEVQPENHAGDENTDNNIADQLITEGDVVIQLNSMYLNAIQASGKGYELKGTLPPVGARNHTIVHAAIYDAVNAIDQSHTPYLAKFDPAETQGASKEAAAVEAGYTALVHVFSNPYFYPDATFFANLKNEFDAQRARLLAQIPDGEAKEKGRAIGQSAAQQIIAARADDGAVGASGPYTPGTDPGSWQPTPTDGDTTETLDTSNAPAVLPKWGLVKPFAIPSATEFRPENMPAHDSPEYARQLTQIQLLGAENSTIRTFDQTEIAQFWAYDRDDTFKPPGQHNQIAQEVALAEGNTLEENARLFALLNMAQADASIVAWNTKYANNQMRPITAIRNADFDNNPDTVGDPNWEPLLDTPPFPDYISGHSVFGGASMQILKNFYGTDNISFEISSQELPGVARSYNSFSQVALENANSRIFGGVHIEEATTDGVLTGQNVADYVFNNFLI